MSKHLERAIATVNEERSDWEARIFVELQRVLESERTPFPLDISVSNIETTTVDSASRMYVYHLHVRARMPGEMP